MKQKLLFTVMLVFSIIQAQGNQQVSTKAQLQDAIDAIAPNEAVSITITNDIEILEAITINDGKKVSINGEGKTLKVTVPGTSAWRLFEVDGENTTLSLSNLILKGGALGNTEAETNYGGAIYTTNKADLILEDVTIQETEAYKGGAVYVTEGNLQIMGTSVFTDNMAYCFGGAVCVESANGQVEISSGSRFDGNSATVSGGALYIDMAEGAIHIGDDSDNSLVEFTNNNSSANSRGGGAIFITQGLDLTKNLDITIKGDFQKNQCLKGSKCNFKDPEIPGCFDRQGGACYIYGGNITIKGGSNFKDNRADGGAALYLHAAKKAIFEENVKFTDNYGIYAGALCFYMSKDVEIQKADFIGNYVTGNGIPSGDNGNGNAIFNEATKLRIINSTFQDNWVDHTSATAGMGTICNTRDSELILDNCSFTNNNSIYGGAVYSNSKIEVLDCKFMNNTATSMGGGICNMGDIKITNCEFLKNTANMAAGVYNAADMEVTNTLFANNEAKGFGGGAICSISMAEEKTTLLTNITVVDNKALNAGGGIFIDGKVTLAIHNSIIWGNTPTNAVNQTGPNPIIYAYSLVEDITDDQNGNIEGIAANKPIFAGDLEPLSIPYYNLDMNSPGIDAGSNNLYTSAVLSDLAGNERIGGGMIEMGAYESKHINVVYHSNFNTEQTVLFRFSPGTTTVTAASYGSLSFPERAGHYFSYWASEANGGTNYGQTIDVTGNSLYHLYAKWSENPKPPIPTDPIDPNNPNNPDPNPDAPIVTITGTLPEGVTIEPGLGSHTMVAGESLTLTIRLGDEYDDKRVFLIIDGDTIELKNVLRATTYTHTLQNVRKNINIRLLFTDKDGTPLSNAEISEGASIRTTLGTVHIQTPVPATLQIISIAGRVFTQQKLAAGETSIQLSAGFYIVILSDGTTQKIMIRE